MMDAQRVEYVPLSEFQVLSPGEHQPDPRPAAGHARGPVLPRAGDRIQGPDDPAADFRFALGPWVWIRFMLGDIGMGVLKLLTGGVCGILWIIDICTIQKTVRDQNFQAIMTVM